MSESVVGEPGVKNIYRFNNPGKAEYEGCFSLQTRLIPASMMVIICGSKKKITNDTDS